MKHAWRETSNQEYFFNVKVTPRHVRVIFQERTITCHKRGCGEPKHLPERKIPRHDRQHGSDWQKADIASNGFSLNRFVGKKSCCIFSIVAATGGAFFYFGDCCFQCLSHLNCDGACPIALSLLENVC